ncbi:MAG: sulfide/dihydroorotate dehydrogenase-like FAD/NAD-binding protein [Candidatus Omnitrophica bacterium]|nr:sulfide/dihydroorotate dehydrogenase-like FAD/NAD-binding protein [Candidatus Omnitrophota bacterium]
MFKILEKKNLGPGIQCILLDAPVIAAKASPGQFIMVRVNESGERIPLTISDFDADKGTITVVFQEAGKTTRLLGALAAGEEVLDVLGPQGNPSEVEDFGNVIVIGGGIGVAPVYPLARKLKEKANSVTALLGYRSKEYVFWEEKIRSVTDRVFIATNDGSYGSKGLVTDLLKEIIGQGGKIDRVFAIGPTIMMKAVSEATRDSLIKTIVSLNSLMVCGMGMCGACRVTVEGKTRFTCMEGPDFDGHAVDFEELMQRLNTYKNEENR